MTRRRRLLLLVFVVVVMAAVWLLSQPQPSSGHIPESTATYAAFA
jgi:hypothetical protein